MKEECMFNSQISYSPTLNHANTTYNIGVCVCVCVCVAIFTFSG